MAKLKRVLIMAGGTGGHVFPGLALARVLTQKNVEVHWLGTQQGIEARLVPAARYPLHTIKVGGLRGKGLKAKLLAPIKVIAATWQAGRVIRQIRPDVVIGMGGFASGPGGLASWLMRCPLVVHEQNARAGLTNKVLARFAKKVLEGFPGAFPVSDKVIPVGNPVRAEIEAISSPRERFKHHNASLRLLVLGGSLGAQGINQVVPFALTLLSKDERPEVIHQAGEKHAEEVKAQYQAMGLTATVKPFIEDMAEAYGWADIVLCRAGALTVAELSAAGLGAIFVPFPYAADDHQTANAQWMVKHNAALCIQQKDLSANWLADQLKVLSQSPGKRLDMADQAYQLRKLHVAEKIFGILAEMLMGGDS